MTKYEPLEIFLANQRSSKSEIALTFLEIEEIISSSLPRSAYEYKAWWGNKSSTDSHTQAKAWISAGFSVKDVQQTKTSGTVIFERA